jgi:precorrin-6B methylase 2
MTTTSSGSSVSPRCKHSRDKHPLRFASRLVPLIAAGLLLLQGCASHNYGDDQFRLGMATHGKDVMWVPTKVDAAHQMLTMADVKPADIVIDLGSGDGVIPIEAARKYGVRSVGIEYNPDLVALSQRNAQRAGVQHLVSLRQGDIFVEDFSEATVLTLYLGEALNAKLKPRILAMKPGTRVVSNTFRMEDWIPDQSSRLTSGENAWLWIVPARLEGDWQISGLPDMPLANLRIRQKTQFFDGSIDSTATRRIAFENGRIRGEEFRFEFTDATKRRHMVSGRISGDEFWGAVEGSDGSRVSGKRRAAPR